MSEPKCDCCCHVDDKGPGCIGCRCARVPSMSECPNCGSAKWPDGDHFVYDCGGPESVACSLIRSLREELAELDERLGIVIIDRDEALSLRAELAKANAECAQLQKQRDDAFRIIELAKDLAAVERDAERDQIADWLLLEGNELAVSFESVSPSTAVHRTWQKIRNNEHRSNT